MKQSEELLGWSDSQTAFVIEMQSQNRRAANDPRFAEPVRLTWILPSIAANATSRGLLDAAGRQSAPALTKKKRPLAGALGRRCYLRGAIELLRGICRLFGSRKQLV